MNLSQNKHIAIYGMGVTGQALKAYLEKVNYPGKISIIENDIVTDESFDCLLISPGINPQNKILTSAKERGVIILSEIDLAINEIISPEKLISITGTNGKSTVTAWLAHALGSEPYGNIGTPLISAEADQDYYVCEMSSFQLEHSKTISSKVSIITNISSDHISWHGSQKAYHNAKLKITTAQTESDYLIVTSQDLYDSIETKAQKILVNLENIPDNINFEPKKIKLIGKHNQINALLVLTALNCLGVKSEHVYNFPGLSHRLEYLGECHGRPVYNDSKSTNPESTITALEAFPDGNVILLLGGKDKNTDLSELSAIVESQCSSIILYGEAQERFSKELDGDIHTVDNLEQAIELSHQLTGDILLLSPACASFDQYQSFEERGEHFRQLVSGKMN